MAAVKQQQNGLLLQHHSSSSSSSSSRQQENSNSGSNSNSDCEVDGVHHSSATTAGAQPTLRSSASSTSPPSSSSAPGSSAVEWVGSACGQHGPYTFYKAAKLSRTSRPGPVILALGDFFLVKLWPDQDIVAIGELQLLWQDSYNATGSSAPLASLKLYFLPENTPDGRHEDHGEDEVVSISEKVVLKVSDLATWIVDDGVKWDRGAASVWERQCATPPLTPPPANQEDPSEEPMDQTTTTTATVLPPTYGLLDMRDVNKEKLSLDPSGELGSNGGGSNVLVLSYPAYCRYRSTLKRLEGHCQTDYMRQAVVEAIGGRAAPSPNTRVVFCKDTFDYPELEDHELLCNHLAPKWKGRPRKMRSKSKRSYSPGSESNESESSVSTVTSSSRSKDSPLKHARMRSVPMGDRPKGEQMFLQKLHKFMAGRGTPIGRLPSLGFKQLDLFLFYTKVQRAGGYESAVANKQWKGIYIELGGHPSNTSAATCTRRHYEKLLLPFERQVLAEPDLMTPSSADSLPPAGAASSGSSGTPPKKRKLSVDPNGDPLNERPEEDEEGSGSRIGGVVESQLRHSSSPEESGGSINNNNSNSRSSSNSPRIVESALPGPPPPPPPPSNPSAPTTTTSSSSSSSSSSVIVWSAAAAEPSKATAAAAATGQPEEEVVVLLPKTPPGASKPPSSGVAVRTDLLLTNSNSSAEETKERLKLEAALGGGSLTLQELMTAGDPASLLAAAAASAGGDPSKALSDLARIAQHLDQSGAMAAKLAGRIKESKINVTDPGQQQPPRPRPSIIQKSGGGSSSSSAAGPGGANSQPPLQPPPAHSQKPVTLPGIVNPAAGIAGESQLSQWYAQMLDGGKGGGGGSHQQLPAAALLELSLRPPTPAAATPSIFVPSRRIYMDPTLDVKKPRSSSSAGGAQGSGTTITTIPMAHHNPQPSRPGAPHQQPTKPPTAAVGSSPLAQTITTSSPGRPIPAAPVPGLIRAQPAAAAAAPPPPPPPQSSRLQPGTIPLVDLTSRTPVKSEDSRAYGGSKGGPAEVNGKGLVDLSHPSMAHSSFRPASGDQKPLAGGLPIHKSSSWTSGSHHGHRSNASDVSISLNVKLEGNDGNHPHQHQQQHHKAASSSSSSHLAGQQPHHRHSVSVVPVIKDEAALHSARHRKEKEMAARPPAVSSQQQAPPQQLHPSAQQQAYPRMVDSLAAMSKAAGPMYSTPSYSAPSSSNTKPTTSGAGSGAGGGGGGSGPYPAGLLDPALASYYSSIYSHPHMYGLPPAVFLGGHHPGGPSAPGGPPHPASMFHPAAAAAAAAAAHHHHQQQMSSAAAEVTAQVYKEMVQRGYPPALAPGLPPGLPPGLAGLSNLSSLGSFASMYSSLGGGGAGGGSGGGAGGSAKDHPERSLPKS